MNRSRSDIKTDDPKIIVALDCESKSAVDALVKQLDPNLCRLKVGNILFTCYGPPLVENLMHKGFSIFLDLKFHDIPQTVAGACKIAANLGVWMINVHVQGGREMLYAAVEAIDQSMVPIKPLLIGVSVLTSLDNNDLKTIGLQHDLTKTVLQFASLAKQTGLNGVVCSAQEALKLRAQFSDNFLLVTPGIRLTSSIRDDQKRVMTPQQAIKAGADYLVIGRAITQAKEPIKVLRDIQNKIDFV